MESPGSPFRAVDVVISDEEICASQSWRVGNKSMFTKLVIPWI